MVTQSRSPRTGWESLPQSREVIEAHNTADFARFGALIQIEPLVSTP
jgi:hypothetical protein